MSIQTLYVTHLPGIFCKGTFNLGNPAFVVTYVIAAIRSARTAKLLLLFLPLTFNIWIIYITYLYYQNES